MLDIYFGRENAPDGYVLDPRLMFTEIKKPWWFENNFVKKFLKVVDKTDVLFEEALRDEAGHGISTEMISTGCKTLCCLLFDNISRAYNGSAMGDNCIPFYIDIALHKDISLFFEHYADIDESYFDKGIIRLNGRLAVFDDYFDGFGDWVGGR